MCASTAMQKETIRRTVIQALKTDESIVANRAHASQRLCDAVLDAVQSRVVSVREEKQRSVDVALCCYFAMAYEADLRPFMKAVWQGALQGIATASTFVPQMIAPRGGCVTAEPQGTIRNSDGAVMAFVKVQGEEDAKSCFAPRGKLCIEELCEAQVRMSVFESDRESNSITTSRLLFHPFPRLVRRADGATLRPATWPQKGSPETHHHAIILAPSSCCDFRKNRLGKGAGYYDSFISAVRNVAQGADPAFSCDVWAVGFDDQLIPPPLQCEGRSEWLINLAKQINGVLPIDSWDEPVDAVLTPSLRIW
jgi:5-formyltetrahydrofolate cyclo-ligase